MRRKFRPFGQGFLQLIYTDFRSGRFAIDPVKIRLFFIVFSFTIDDTPVLFLAARDLLAEDLDRIWNRFYQATAPAVTKITAWGWD